jgi:hypothetical protein
LTPGGARKAIDFCATGNGRTPLKSCSKYKPDATTEAHLTLVFGDGIHACGAAAIGENLKLIDGERQRIAFVHNISAETRSVLEHAWQVREVSPLPGVYGQRARKAALLDARDGSGALLTRAVYWDTDHLPLARSGDTDSAARGLRKLWAASPAAQMVASPERAGCWNSGLMLFRPSERARYEYEALVRSGAIPRTCGAFTNRGVNSDDQRWLNAVYRTPGARDESVMVRRVRAASANLSFLEPATGTHLNLTRLGAETFRVRTAWITLGSRWMPPCDQTSGQLEAHANSYHFYSRLPPFGANCAECVANNQPCNGRIASKMSVVPECAFFAAQAAWWTALGRLPPPLKALCVARSRSTHTIDRAFYVKTLETGMGRFAGCNLTDNHTVDAPSPPRTAPPPSRPPPSPTPQPASAEDARAPDSTASAGHAWWPWYDTPIKWGHLETRHG